MRHTDLFPWATLKILPIHLALLNIVPQRTALSIISVISFHKQNTYHKQNARITLLLINFADSIKRKELMIPNKWKR